MLDFGRGFFVVIVKAHFAPGDYFGIFRQLVELRVVLFLSFGGVLRMDSNRGVDPVVIFRYGERGIQTVRPRPAAADRQNSRHASRPRSLQHFSTVGIEFFRFEMRV